MSVTIGLNSKQFKGIVEGTYTETDHKAESEKTEEKEVIDAEVSMESTGNSSGVFGRDDVPPEVQIALEKRLQQVNQELERGILTGQMVSVCSFSSIRHFGRVIDSELFADLSVFNNDIGFSHRQVNKFIQGVCRFERIGWGSVKGLHQ